MTPVMGRSLDLLNQYARLPQQAVTRKTAEVSGQTTASLDQTGRPNRSFPANPPNFEKAGRLPIHRRERRRAGRPSPQTSPVKKIQIKLSLGALDLAGGDPGNHDGRAD